VATSALHPGSAYLLRSYAPDPTAVQLRRDNHRYPWARLMPYLSATIPDGGSQTGVPFAPFGATSSIVALEMGHSPYAPAYALAQRLAAGAATPYAFVKAVQHYLDDGAYRYDQKTTPTRYPLLDFLFHSKVGYCQQFSGAMALLLRMGGVPARVAAGFTSGSFDPAGHAWTVSDIDAHAWVEVWFPRYGWVKFDPTPTSAPARSGAPPTNDEHEEQLLGFDHTLRLGETQGEVQSNTTTTTTTSRHRTRGSAGAGAGSGSGGSGPTWPWLAGGGLLVLGLAGGGWWRGARVSRHGDPLTELERALARTGRPLRAGVTLAELERRFHDSPEAAGYVRALRLARYGGLSEPLSGAGRRALRAELRLGLGLAGRLRALWALPPRLPSRLQSRLHRT
jgi:transglutaminase-like putative cysteine protease